MKSYTKYIKRKKEEISLTGPTFGGDPVPDTDSRSVFHCGIVDFRRFGHFS